MKFTPRKINLFLMFKLPAAFFCGVRVKNVTQTSCTTTVKHRWINQNPFRSMYFAVQCMAAELSTGVLVMQHIQESQSSISMLVGSQKGEYLKKATGRITFTCDEGTDISNAIQETLKTGEGQTVLLKSTGIDQQGDVVSVMQFEWKVKRKF